MKLSTRSSRASRSKRSIDVARSKQTVQRFAERILAYWRRYNPLSLLGFCIFGGAIYLLGTGFATGNAYSFLLSTIFLAVLLVVSITTRLEARRARSFEFSWDSTDSLLARQSKSTQRLSNAGYRPLPFLRAHMVIRGHFTPGRNQRFRVSRNFSFGHSTDIDVGLYFPYSGTLYARYIPEIRDLFGLSRAPFGEERDKVVPVRPGHVSDKNPPRIEAQQGDENQNRMKSSDIERYFMREYIPGDRERDINWKASSRYFQLFTRISPVTQEKTRLITVFFRPYNSHRVDTIESLALLDRVKSMLMFFLRSVHVVHPEYIFRLFIGNDLVEIESDDDIEQLASELAGVHFRNYGGSSEVTAEDLVGGAFVFTTVCDTGISDFLNGFNEDTVELYMCRAARSVDDEGVIVRLFDEIDSFLPEMLLMARSRNTRKAPPISSSQHITEEVMEVRFG